jgi:phage baseplate assembly protein W
MIPLTLNSDGTFATTDDPVQVVRLRILDLLVTSNWERVHRPTHGCDLEGFLYTNVVDHILALKADEIMTTINNTLTYGEVVQVRLTPVPAPESAVAVEVLYRVYAGGEIESLVQTFTGVAEEGNPS